MQPILDDHLHLDPVNGQGAEAVTDFVNVGGTHLLVLNKPSWELVGEVDGETGFREAFELTIDVTERASE
ncbi:deoxyribonuclease, partial [Halobacteriales archaeon SW_8_65_20]